MCMRSRCLLLCFHSGLLPSKYERKRECSSNRQPTGQRGQRFFLQAQAVPALRASRPLCRNRRLAAEPGPWRQRLEGGPWRSAIAPDTGAGFAFPKRFRKQQAHRAFTQNVGPGKKGGHFPALRRIPREQRIQINPLFTQCGQLVS